MSGNDPLPLGAPRESARNFPSRSTSFSTPSAVHPFRKRSNGFFDTVESITACCGISDDPARHSQSHHYARGPQSALAAPHYEIRLCFHKRRGSTLAILSDLEVLRPSYTCCWAPARAVWRSTKSSLKFSCSASLSTGLIAASPAIFAKTASVGPA